MISPRTTARAVGALIIISYVAVFAGVALMGPALDLNVPLAEVDGDRAAIAFGAIGNFINDAAVVGIAALLLPFFKRTSAGLALWYLGLRVFEGAMYLVGTAAVLSISSLAERAVEEPALASELEPSRHLAIGLYEGADFTATAGFLAGALLLYVLIYRSRIVPRFIAIWGFVAVPLVVLLNVLAPNLSDASGAVMLLVVPIVTNEIFLAIWLLVRGIRVPDDAGVSTAAEVVA